MLQSGRGADQVLVAAAELNRQAAALGRDATAFKPGSCRLIAGSVAASDNPGDERRGARI